MLEWGGAASGGPCVLLAALVGLLLAPGAPPPGPAAPFPDPVPLDPLCVCPEVTWADVWRFLARELLEHEGQIFALLILVLLFLIYRALRLLGRRPVALGGDSAHRPVGRARAGAYLPVGASGSD